MIGCRNRNRRGESVARINPLATIVSTALSALVSVGPAAAAASAELEWLDHGAAAQERRVVAELLDLGGDRGRRGRAVPPG